MHGSVDVRGSADAFPAGARPMRPGGFARTITLLLALLVWLPAAAAPHGVTVFAASSLTEALQSAGQAYEQTSGQTVHFSFASSSTLARQIAEGAPADVFISADRRWMDYVAKQKRLVAGSRVRLLANQLVLVAPVDSVIKPLALVPGVPLAQLLGEGRLAMGNPAHVPAGIYGKQALQALGVWATVQDKVARSANVRAALALVALDAAPLGIVYRTDALASDKVKVVGTFPADSHAPIVYPAALLRRDGAAPGARDFLHFLQTDQAAAIFARYGFQVLH